MLARARGSTASDLDSPVKYFNPQASSQLANIDMRAALTMETGHAGVPETEFSPAYNALASLGTCSDLEPATNTRALRRLYEGEGEVGEETRVAKPSAQTIISY
jgi:hypothetical protein